jgi:hypothetical protein
MPLAVDGNGAGGENDLLEKAQFHHHHRHPHHRRLSRRPRRWVCHWHRGRRICGWR